MIPLNTSAGERRAWEIIRGLDPGDVCRRAGATWEPSSGAYHVDSFGMAVRIDPAARRVSSAAAGSRLLLEQLRDLFVPSVLVYLTSAKEIPPTGRLVRPQQLRAGQLFSVGTHVLPLADLAARYGGDREAFLARGRALGAQAEPHGDAALILRPLPRLPLHLVLWLADEEFPARAELLLDSSCEIQAPADLLWAVTTVSVLAMIRSS